MGCAGSGGGGGVALLLALHAWHGMLPGLPPACLPLTNRSRDRRRRRRNTPQIPPRTRTPLSPSSPSPPYTWHGVMRVVVGHLVETGVDGVGEPSIPFSSLPAWELPDPDYSSSGSRQQATETNDRQWSLPSKPPLNMGTHSDPHRHSSQPHPHPQASLGQVSLSSPLLVSDMGLMGTLIWFLSVLGWVELLPQRGKEEHFREVAENFTLWTEKAHHRLCLVFLAFCAFIFISFAFSAFTYAFHIVLSFSLPSSLSLFLRLSPPYLWHILVHALREVRQ